jgi:[acyl-carrier-protein] S-malonyltransferase
VIVAMFPGQGAQAVGMGQDLAGAYDVARRTFEEADDVLGYALSEICFSGPAERLTATDVCQPALVATSVAAFRVAAEVGLEPGLVLGHSLGEYSALVAAGAMDYATALRTVAERGSAMREAGRAAPGGMAALLGPSDDEARALADEAGEVWPANFNCPGQVVVSGSEAGIDRIVALAGERGIRVARLAVDGPFHSPLIAAAADRLRPALEAWEPAAPDPPFLSTTTCALEPPERLRAVLLDQLTSPVRFGDAVLAAVARGAERFVELGPGRVLSGLVRRVRRDLATAQVGEPGDLAALAEAISVSPGGAR